MTAKDKLEIKLAFAEALELWQAKQLAEADEDIRLPEVMQMTGWSESTIYKRKDLLKAWKCGGTLFFSKRHITRIIQKNKPTELKHGML